MLRCAIVGVAGYTGGELAHILLDHPHAALTLATADSSAGQSLESLHPSLIGRTDLTALPTSIDTITSLNPDAVFLATPHEVSLDLAPRLLDALPDSAFVLDLSGAFRLSDPALYPANYNFTHHHFLRERAFAIMEFISDEDLRAARLLSIPGCYATAAILAIRPIADANLIDQHRPVIISAASGISGAGRSPKLHNLFSELSFRPYNLLAHRHQPEIIEHAHADVIFTPHVGPWHRGIIATTHIPLLGTKEYNNIESTYLKKYADSPFLRLVPPNAWPAVADVANSDRCDLAFAIDQDRDTLIVITALDNLRKGAASQAIHAMNVRSNLPPTAALAPKHM